MPLYNNYLDKNMITIIKRENKDKVYKQYVQAYKRTVSLFLLRSDKEKNKIENTEKLIDIIKKLRKQLGDTDNKLLFSLISNVKNRNSEIELSENSSYVKFYIKEKVYAYLDKIFLDQAHSKANYLLEFVNHSLKKGYIKSKDVNYMIMSYIFERLNGIEHKNKYNNEEDKNHDLLHTYNIIFNIRAITLSNNNLIRVLSYYLGQLDILSLFNNLYIIEKVLSYKLSYKDNKISELKIIDEFLYKLLLESVRRLLENKDELRIPARKEAELIFYYIMKTNNDGDIYINNKNTLFYIFKTLKEKRLIEDFNFLKDSANKDIENEKTFLYGIVELCIYIGLLYTEKAEIKNEIKEFKITSEITNKLIKLIDDEKFDEFALISSILLELRDDILFEPKDLYIKDLVEFGKKFSDILTKKLRLYVDAVAGKNIDIMKEAELSEELNKAYGIFVYLVPVLRNLKNFDLNSILKILEDPTFRSKLDKIISYSKNIKTLKDKSEELENMLNDFPISYRENLGNLYNIF